MADTKTMKISEIASKIGAKLTGDGDAVVRGVNAIESAGPDELTFVSDVRHEAKTVGSKAAGVIVARQIAELSKTQLIVDNVDKALVETLGLFAPELKAPAAGVHPSAVVEATAVIAKSASIGPNAYIGVNTRIGERTLIGPGCYVGENTVIGNDCRFDANVVVYHNCVIGNNVVLQANTTIGSIGFGYAYFDEKHNLIPHNGNVVIEDFVEIGANSCVDRAKFGSTIVGAGSKVDNLVQVAHNVVIGKCCLLAAQVGIAGSSKLGNGVVLGGQVGMADHISIGDGTMVGARSGIVSDLPAGQKMAGTPAIEIREALRIVMATQKLPELVKQIKDLANRIKQLESTNDNTK